MALYDVTVQGLIASTRDGSLAHLTSTVPDRYVNDIVIQVGPNGAVVDIYFGLHAYSAASLKEARDGAMRDVRGWLTAAGLAVSGLLSAHAQPQH